MEGEQEVRSLKLLEEIKVDQRSVETSIRIYGPANITSLLDMNTYAEKLSRISEKLEVFLEKADEVKDKLDILEKLESKETIDNGKRSINDISNELVEKVTKNELEVKKKIECLIKASNGSPNKSNLSPTEEQEEKTAANISSLSRKIYAFCEAGPFLTHLPQFVYLIKYIVSQYQKKLPEFG